MKQYIVWKFPARVAVARRPATVLFVGECRECAEQAVVADVEAREPPPESEWAKKHVPGSSRMSIGDWAYRIQTVSVEVGECDTPSRMNAGATSRSG